MMRNLFAALLAALVLTVAGSNVSAQPPTTITVPLAPGWNNVAYLGPAMPVSALVTAVGPALRRLWEFDAATQTWRAFDPAHPRASDLTQVTFQRAYWAYMAEKGAVTMTLPQEASGFTLYPGMNNIAYVSREMSLVEALAAAGSRVSGVWRWDADAQRWRGAVPSNAAASEFTLMTPGRAYSVLLDAGAPVALRGVGASGGGAARRRECHPFQARQPDLTETRTAFNKAAFGTLVADPAMALPPLKVQTDGPEKTSPGYVPPTLLKAIGWVESSWRQAEYEAPRGARGRALVSASCAIGIMQVLSGMEIKGTPTPLQERIGSEFQHNIAAGARILAQKWNLAPSDLPLVKPRSPASLEDWYYAVWAYHCFGERCAELGLHDNPDDPTLAWPRPIFNSPDQLAGKGRYSRADYPYQELVYGLVQYPPSADGVTLWQPLPVKLPQRGAVGFPTPGNLDPFGSTTDPTRPSDP
jgi:hypothetical protein